MSFGQDTRHSANSSKQPDGNYPVHMGMNPAFVPQASFNAPFMPQFYPSSQCVPFQNMMSPAFNPIVCSMPDQAAMNQWKSAPAFLPNSANFPAHMGMSSYSQTSASAFPYQNVQNFNNQENVPPVNTQTPNVPPVEKTRNILPPSNTILAFQSTPSAFTTLEKAQSSNQSPSNKSSNTSMTSCAKQDNQNRTKTCKVEKTPNEDKPGKSTEHSRDELNVMPKEVANSDTEEEPTNSFAERDEFHDMCLLIGSVEDVLKWSTEKKSVSSLEVLIQFIGVFVKVLKADENQSLLLVQGLKPNSPSLQVLFYSTDRSMPSFTPNQAVLFSGFMKGSRKFHVYDFEIVIPSLLSEIGRIIPFSSRAVKDLPS